MLRRSGKSATALDQTKEQLARQESELRGQMEKLERMIADAPRMAEEEARRQREELRQRAGAETTRLDVSLGAHDKWMADGAGVPQRRGSLRKQRREGRIIFLVLAITLVAAVIWLIAHLRSF
jgi:septal ring factor EnvC (AmiA/AmiB activator)